MPYLLIIVGAFLLILLFLRRPLFADTADSQSADPHPSLPEQNFIPLKTTEEGRDWLTYKGVDYFAWEGEYDPEADLQVWDWHGRMGEGLGFLVRDNALFPDGELYTLRGQEDVLLAFLPRDGWPITDMQIFLPRDLSLPSLPETEFAKGELYRIEGEFEEEQYEKIGEIEDLSLLTELASAWQKGPDGELPDGEYQRFRVRLYTREIPGLYAIVNLNRSETTGETFVEKYRFAGDTPLPCGWKDFFN